MTNWLFPERLLQQFETAETQYAELKQQAQAQVVNWRWATDSMFDIEPYFNEAHRTPKGKWLDHQPETFNQEYCYGYDAHDRVVAERSNHIVFPFSEAPCFKERFLFYKEQVVENYYFDYATPQHPEKLIRLLQHHYTDGLLTCTYSTNKSSKRIGTLIERYFYENRLLARKEQHQEVYEPASNEEKEVYEETLLYHHELDGTLKLIETSTGYVYYQKKTKGMSLKKLSELAQDKTVEEIIKAIQARQADGDHNEPVYALFLMYGSGDEAVPPPMLYLAKDSYRQARLLDDDSENIWNPNEFEGYGADDMMFDYQELDKDSLKLFDLLNQELEMQNSETPFYKYVTQVGKRLKEIIEENSQSLNLQITPDFVVAPTHYEGHDLKKNLKAINPEQFKLLKKTLPDWG